MRRILCVWLPRFLTDRLTRTQSEPATQPDALLAVIASGKGGNRLVAVNAAAEAIGLKPGMLLTEATAIAPELRAMPQNAQQEAAHLRRLALWCRRYTPWVAPDAPDSLRLDMTGAAHLLGGEAAVLRDIRRRFAAAGFSCRAATASTPAAAWAMARYGRASLSIIPDGEERKRLAPLPVRALRIEEDKAAALDRLGLKSISQLFDLPRPQLRARFGAALCAGLDCALGIDMEAQASLAYEAVYHEQLDFAEPVSTLDSVQVAAGLLTSALAARLRADGKAARGFTLTLYDTQGGTADVVLSLARPSHDAEHIARLFRERFTTLEARFEKDTAFDAATLLARRIEHPAAVQSVLTDETASEFNPSGLSTFLDRLNARFGDGAVKRFAFRESHLPERASGAAPTSRPPMAPPPLPHPRPFLLLPRVEEIPTTAELPDYPPRRFTWRRVSHRVVKADGPERIASEWWHGGGGSAPARDYYAVEDEKGQRFWMYREGAYVPDGPPPCWYMHGLLP